MESIKILKISLVFFAFMFLMKNLNDMEKNKTKNIETKKKIIKENFSATPLEPGQAGFKYGGKDDKEFTFLNKKLVGSNTDYTQYESAKFNSQTGFCAATMANDAYIYLDERYSYDPKNLPYNAENVINPTSKIPGAGIEITRVDKLSKNQSKIGKIVKQSDYIPILLPVVDYPIAGDSNSGELELKKPQTILLSYKDKKITTKDTNTQCVYKGEDNTVAANPNDKKTCNKHEGYCSFMSK